MFTKQFPQKKKMFTKQYYFSKRVTKTYLNYKKLKQIQKVAVGNKNKMLAVANKKALA